MSSKLSSLRKRLAKLEQEQADRAKVEELADCNCPEFKSGGFLAVFPRAIGALGAPEAPGALEALEAEMNETCPVHGLRRLGDITVMDFGTESEDTAKLDQLIDEYELRLAQHSQASIATDKEQ